MINPTVKEVIARHHQAMSPAIGHYQEIAFEKGDGFYLYDFEGNQYIDFAIGIATCSIGHCHPEVVKAIQDQAAKLIHTSMVGYYLENVEYAELIKQIVPPTLQDGKVLLMNSGSEAVEAALKLVRMVSKRTMILAFSGGFHGRPMGALAATASASVYRKGLSSLLVGVQHAVYPYCYRCPLGHKSKETCDLACVTLIRQILKTTLPADELAGILIEPIAGEFGYIVPPKEFIEELRKICDEAGAALIFDEIQTGAGRTGKMFACEHYSIEPDVLIFAKAAGGGMPLGGFIAKKEIGDKWAVGSHGSTFGGNPLSCQAGKKTLEVIIRDNLVQNASEIGKSIIDKFNNAKEDLPAIGEVRGLGLMIGVELIKSDGSPNTELMKKVLVEAGNRGLVLCKAGESVVRICPPLNITKDIADEAVDIILQIIVDLC
ncbi:aspartate aminotransferase family protein [Desulfitibacter alkalitolerans]|uniref:aspartate aminotransferase family protein n=1 Tax=Desulfitibacter alkalitolerans TaxID=264641 RepID=UPI0006873D88|nr:aminotransferase class III-fold pyridoxal phosphate-dependent enzyme [Desulfitibacter alkalitolerans]